MGIEIIYFFFNVFRFTTLGKIFYRWIFCGGELILLLHLLRFSERFLNYKKYVIWKVYNVEKTLKFLFLFSVFLFVDESDLKTNEKTFNKKCLVCFEFISVKLFNLYLPNYRGRSHKGRYRELNLMWLVILLICEWCFWFQARAKAIQVLLWYLVLQCQQ